MKTAKYCREYRRNKKMKKKDCMKCDYWIGEYGCIHNHTDMYKCENQEMYMDEIKF